MNMPPHLLTDTLISGKSPFVCFVFMKTITATFVLEWLIALISLCQNVCKII